MYVFYFFFSAIWNLWKKPFIRVDIASSPVLPNPGQQQFIQRINKNKQICRYLSKTVLTNPEILRKKSNRRSLQEGIVLRDTH